MGCGGSNSFQIINDEGLIIMLRSQTNQINSRELDGDLSEPEAIEQEEENIEEDDSEEDEESYEDNAKGKQQEEGNQRKPEAALETIQEANPEVNKEEEG